MIHINIKYWCGLRQEAQQRDPASEHQGPTSRNLH